MYATLLTIHSIVRWLVLLSLVYAIIRAFRGWGGKRAFTRTDLMALQAASGFAQLQLVIGYVLYFYSPLMQYFRSNFSEALQQPGMLFFGLIHITLMTLSVALLSIGTASTKRQETDSGKFRKMAVWFSLALLIIFIAIPWPFSPLAHRPLLRF